MLEKIINLGISKREALELIKVSKDIEKDYNLLCSGYPVQYLIKYVDFYGNKIEMNESVLIPRYETELLVEKTIKYLKGFNNPSIVDIGTGSASIAIALKKNIKCEIDAIDISLDTLEIAKKNALNNNVNINFIHNDLLNDINIKYDCIISNPPYISYDEEVPSTVKDYEPHIALFAEDNGLYFYKKILDSAKKHLKDKYLIAFEIGCTQGHDIKEYAKSIFTNAIINIEKDYSGKDRYIFIFNE